MATEFHGSLVLVLHSHIPYVLRHDPLAEEMLFEAAAESYLPLLECLDRLVAEGVSPRITVSLSPCLAEQLADPHFKRRFLDYCSMRAGWAACDLDEFEGHNAHMAWLARRWMEFYVRTGRSFADRYQGDLVGAFRRLEQAGHVELMTCAASHAYLPVLYSDATVKAQVQAAVASHRRHFGTAPRGMWLPECGYRPPRVWQPPFTSRSADPPRNRAAFEDILAANGLHYFVIDGEQLIRSWPPDLAKVPFDACVSGGLGGQPPLAVFARDPGLSRQVWDRHLGYPGDGAYLDFHKRHGLGRHRYWKVTRPDLDMAYKDPYYPDDAERFKVAEHAGHYKGLVAQTLRQGWLERGRPGTVVVAFDTELFGHWWFEGPQWLYHVLKWINADPEIRTATPSEEIRRSSPQNRVWLAESSWGRHLDHSTWVNPEVEWIWEHIYHAERELGYLAAAFGNGHGNETLRRLLRQAGREAFLLMASDWQFMVTNDHTRDWAQRRVHEHHADFERLAKMAWDHGQGRSVPEGEWRFLADAEARNHFLTGAEIDAFSVPPL